MTTPHNDPERARQEIAQLRDQARRFLAELARLGPVTEIGRKAFDLVSRSAQEAVEALEDVEQRLGPGSPYAYIGGRVVNLETNEALAMWDKFEERWIERSDP